MLSYVAVSPISLPDGARFKLDDAFSVADNSFSAGEWLTYGVEVPKHFLLKSNSVGKKTLTFVNQFGDIDDNTQHKQIELMVVKNLYQINEGQGVEASEFNTFKTDWRATVVPIGRGGTGRTTGRNVIAALRPQDRLWTRPTFQFVSLLAEGIPVNNFVPFNFDKALFGIDWSRPSKSVFQGFFDSDLNSREDNKREIVEHEVTVDHGSADIGDTDIADYPFIIYEWFVHQTRFVQGSDEHVPRGLKTTIDDRQYLRLTGWVVGEDSELTSDLAREHEYYRHSHLYDGFLGINDGRVHWINSVELSAAGKLKGLTICSRI